jgi:ATP-dependent DNA helicase RecQ
MDRHTFFGQCMALDIEARAPDRIWRIGARFRGRSLYRDPRTRPGDVLDELGREFASARYLVGHNLIGHDLPILQAVAPRATLMKRPVVDTLYLSPLAFPENPYHRLVKGYKLVASAISDPTEDADLSLALLHDEWEVFASMLTNDPGRVGIYRYCFDRAPQTLPAFFDALGAPRLKHEEVLENAMRIAAPFCCRSAVESVLSNALSDPHGCLALAYVLAWLPVSGSNSVIPRWVGEQFPAAIMLVQELRDKPCYDKGCTHCAEAHDPVILLDRYFGFPSFRPLPAAENGDSLQEAVVRMGISGQPHLAILPTGGGKSLCYQLPALARNYRTGVLTIVISPLQALMKDQVDGLAANTGTPFAGTLNGMLTPPERSETMERVVRGDIAILYVSPEQLRNGSFRKTIAQRRIGCWVFDEAHCLSKWGHEFRPDYLYAGRFIRDFAKEQGVAVPPVACFTATAKRDVREEIRTFFNEQLDQTLPVFEADVGRQNLSFAVIPVKDAEKLDVIHTLLSDRLPRPELGSAVVFRATRSAATETAERLRERNWEVEAFHAGLNAPEKRRVQDEFIGGTCQVVCATNAFGMGIDKEDVRLVIHGDIPGSLENYIQEAGRAGRDNQQAECILLYDEQDSESQFRLGALSQLSRRDIAQVLRGLRRARRNPDGEIVITAGELLRDDEVETSFDVSDGMADTKVRSAVSWLERADFLERNENRTMVFQGRPLVQSLDEGLERMGKMNLSLPQRDLWRAFLFRIMTAKPDEGLRTDDLAALQEFQAAYGERLQVREGDQPAKTAGGLVMRVLNHMATAGLIDQDLMLTAYIRYKVGSHSRLIFERVCALEIGMLDRLREEDPDVEDWGNLSLRRLNQTLRDDGFACTPELLRDLLLSLSLDGKGLAAGVGSIRLRYLGRDQYRVKFQRSWDAVLRTAEIRRNVAGRILETLFDKIPEDTPASADLLVSFAQADLTRAVTDDLALNAMVRDPIAAVERGLTFLHEQKVIILQQGLAVFRAAMTIRIRPEAKGRQYTLGDFSPLAHHHRERIFQVHVMNEYARLGMEKIQEALRLVLDYFSKPKEEFVASFFGEDRKMLEHATTAGSYRRIVDELRNAVQISVVAAKADENLLILAGPGSGKTRTVIHRCAYLLRVERIPPRSILVLAFNRGAAVELRKRLWDLVGPDARGVTIQTYHGLAMRLTGTSVAGLADRDPGAGPIDFEQLILDAIDLLSQPDPWPGMGTDELRERILAGYRYILVDEYQDIDAPQYELVSAIAGRTRSDPDTKLSILAVGDDDQNIYAFRGANVEFIRRFESDYQARTAHLVENYRSPHHILAAANALIAHNEDRMKHDKPIRVDRARRDEPRGGAWNRKDPVARGRVQCLGVEDAAHQAAAVVDEIDRLRALQPGLPWSGFSVLARTHVDLDVIRSLCEVRQIPVSRPARRGELPPVHRFRETACLLECLHQRENEMLRPSELMQALSGLRGDRPTGVWWEMLAAVLAELREDTGDARIPGSEALEFVYEALLDYRRDHTIGWGVHLSTVHAAKGREFPHVVITAGGWQTGRTVREREEERRVFYVGMTRARETLTLMEQRDTRHPFLSDLKKAALLSRSAPRPPTMPEGILHRRFGLLGLADLFLDFAGRRSSDDPVHQALAGLNPGDPLHVMPDGQRLGLHTSDRQLAALLSRDAQDQWGPRLKAIESVRVFAMVRRRKQDVRDPEFAAQCVVDAWELPLAELTYRQVDG